MSKDYNKLNLADIVTLIFLIAIVSFVFYIMILGNFV